ncbi:hypothetical protein FF098_003135 [Parvularcula flava]|uniref:Uncharacterized protein n=1 Tax=Aquisalinus luteolus TaxID=1566827 RepID=A0A8J3A4S9_9PROT|nr:hypothetical protein [Aquisalinus luteolus]NHK26901.1 hypothetical protein [Aquisalinus luteolus]GGH93758.1 hypothetical protein GCM10011355_06350 [Aquisalinus luteolus]
MRLSATLAILMVPLLAVTACTDEDAAEGFDIDHEEIAATGALVTEELLSRETFMMYEVDTVIALHYAEVAAAYGALELAGLTGRDDFVSALTDRYERTISEEIPNSENHVDANVLGVWPLELYMQSGGEDYLERGIALADGQWVDADPEPACLSRPATGSTTSG